MKRMVAGIAALAIAIAFAWPAVAATKKTTKPVQAQISTCNKCDKKMTNKRKDCNKPDCKKAKDCYNCDKAKDDTPCPSDCPKKSK